MSNKDQNTKKTVIQVGIAIALVVGLMITAYIIVSYEPDIKMIENKPHTSDSNIVTNDAQKTAALFVEANGNIGNTEKDITIKTLESGEAIENNSKRRLEAFYAVNRATIPGSPLIKDNQDSYIRKYTSKLNTPYTFKVENVSTSKPSKISKLIINTNSESTEYEAVDVYVSFDSIMTTFVCATDTSYDGTHTQMDNKAHFDKLKVTLVNSGDLWFVYDIENAEKVVNERFATWRGVSPSTIDYRISESVGVIKVPGVDRVEEPTPLPSPPKKEIDYYDWYSDEGDPRKNDIQIIEEGNNEH